ncbi:MAG TPA: hypothetical protein VFR71_01090, partial [Methyloceanibacter sp.]|nr:hypothetical protein [Methyloceanibacter sp.]
REDPWLYLPRRDAGLPQISIPAGEAAGCPIGLSFIGWRGADEALLDLAVSIEPMLPSAV